MDLVKTATPCNGDSMFHNKSSNDFAYLGAHQTRSKVSAVPSINLDGSHYITIFHEETRPNRCSLIFTSRTSNKDIPEHEHLVARPTGNSTTFYRDMQQQKKYSSADKNKKDYKQTETKFVEIIKKSEGEIIPFDNTYVTVEMISYTSHKSGGGEYKADIVFSITYLSSGDVKTVGLSVKKANYDTVSNWTTPFTYMAFTNDVDFKKLTEEIPAAVTEMSNFSDHIIKVDDSFTTSDLKDLPLGAGAHTRIKHRDGSIPLKELQSQEADVFLPWTGEGKNTANFIVIDDPSIVTVEDVLNNMKPIDKEFVENHPLYFAAQTVNNQKAGKKVDPRFLIVYFVNEVVVNVNEQTGEKGILIKRTLVTDKPFEAKASGQGHNLFNARNDLLEKAEEAIRLRDER